MMMMFVIIIIIIMCKACAMFIPEHCILSVAGKFVYQKRYDVNVCKQETSLLNHLIELEKFHYFSI